MVFPSPAEFRSLLKASSARALKATNKETEIQN